MRLSGLTWVLGTLLAATGAVSGASAQVSTPSAPTSIPSVRIMTGTLVAPNSTTYSTTSTNGLCNSFSSLPQASYAQLCSGFRPPEVRELARALKNDPNLIYEYVRNSIDTEFQFGLQKGAVGAIIDGTGTPFDQAELMVELLREAGANNGVNYNPSYHFGVVSISGAAFYNWTGITNATAACKFLATGGIPATINGATTASDCSGLTGAVVQLTMQHIWVQASVNGGSYFFDPSYKPYTQKIFASGLTYLQGTAPAGQTLQQAMGYTTGAAFTKATSGMSSGSPTVGAGSASYVSSLNSSGLATSLNTYATTLLGVLKTNYQGADMTDVVGGHIIVPLGPRPAGGWKQATVNQVDANNNPTLTYSTAPATTTTPAGVWTPPSTVNVTGIPDQFRTTLRVTAVYDTSQPAYFDTTFFVDEIYGRRMMLQSGGAGSALNPGTGQNPFIPAGASSYPTQIYIPLITLDGVTIGSGPYGDDLNGVTTSLTLTPGHPFAASSSGAFNYDAPVTKLVDPLYPALIVHGWGHTSEGLAAKWQAEAGNDTNQPKMWIDHSTDNPAPYFAAPSGDLERSNIGATWLAQFSQAGELHAEIAGARLQHLHTLGVVAAEQNITIPSLGGQVQLSGGKPCTSSCPPLNGIQPVDQLGYLDVETSFGLTSRASNVAQRRAAVHAIAATAAALEGSVFEQLTDNPDASSTARRFAWGNSPEAGETPSTASRPVYLFNLANQGSSLNISPNFFTAEGLATDNTQTTGLAGNAPGWGDWGGEVEAVQPIAINTATNAIAGGVNQYLSNAFCGSSSNCEVIASTEALLGPGFRNGSTWVNSFYESAGGAVTTGSELDITNPNQVGGALIANQYDANGDPLQIAHIVISQSQRHKGGGGGMTDAVNFNAQNLKNSLKDRFVDRSTQLAVDLKSGVASFSSPVLESVGGGEFPYKLDRRLEQRGGGMKVLPFYPNADTTVSNWVSNWESSADPSNSGSEAMGKSRVEASAATIAAFVAMQDIWSNPAGASREVSGELVADWWGRQLTFNVVTVSLGAKNEAFVRLADGTYLPTAGGGDRLGLASGFTRTAVRPYTEAHVNGCSGCAYPISSRQWRYQQSGTSSFTWTGINGDIRQYSYWEGNLNVSNQQSAASASDTGSSASYTSWDSGETLFQKNSGFRLNTWQFPYGVTLTLNYGPISSAYLIGSGGVAVSQTAAAEGIAQVGPGIPISVSSSLGWTLNLPGKPIYGCWGAETLSASDLASETTQAAYLAAQAITPTSRPVATCLLSAVYDPINQTLPSIQYAYDSLGRVMQAQDAVSIQQGAHGPYNYYIAPGYRGEWDDPLGGQYTLETMQGGRLLRTTNELGYVVTTAMDGRHRVTSRTFPEGDQEAFTYNGIDQVLSLTKIAKPSAPATNITVSATYDPVWNKLASLTDALGNTTSLTYYGAGTSGASLLQQAVRPKPTTTASAPTYHYAYNAIGLPTSEIDATGVTTTHSYDAYGDLTSTTSGAAAVGSYPAVNATTTYVPDTTACPPGATSSSCPSGGVGNVTNVVDPLGKTTAYQYDLMRRKTGEQHFDGGTSATILSSSTWIFDLNGRTISASRALYAGATPTWLTTLTSYTPTNKTASTTDPLGNVVQMSYDADDRLLCQAVRMTPVLDGSLPDACTLTPGTDPLNPDRITQYAYDAAGEKLSETRAFGVVASTIFPTTLQQTYATYAYTPNGQIQKVWDANNNLTTYVYDGFDRLIQTQFPSKSVAASQAAATSDTGDVESYSYDANGNRLTLAKRDGVNTISWCYDALNREVDKYLHSITAGGGCTAAGGPPALSTNTSLGNDVATTYDLAGRKLTAQYAAGQGAGIAYAYDAAGRAVSESTNGLAVTFGYDASSNLARMTWPDGAPTNFYVAYTYDGLNRVYQVEENGATTGAGILATFAYDTLGRRNSATLGNGVTTSYAFDSDDHLTSLGHSFAAASTFNVTFGPFLYNPAHQILQRASNNSAYDFTSYVNGVVNKTANGLNQDAAIAAVTGGYDGNGNETNDGTRTFTYDVENRLTSVTNPSSSTTVNLAYDPAGRLLTQQATVSGSTTNTQFLYAGDKLVAEYATLAATSTTPPAQRYVHGAGTDEPLVWYPGSGTSTKYYLHTDNQGTVIAYSDASGVVTSSSTYSYGAYGEPNTWSGERFRYTGQIMLSKAGLYYYKARVYDPVSGHFLQTDPVGYKDNVDLYAYAGDDPVDGSDPTGMAKDWSTIDDSSALGITASMASGISALQSAFMGGATAAPAPSPPSAPQAPGTPSPANDNSPAPANDNAPGRVLGTLEAIAGAPLVAAGALINALVPSHAPHESEDESNFVLYHYTTPGGMASIVSSGVILPSLLANNPRDAQHGDGQYFTDIPPGTMTNKGLSLALYGVAANQWKVSNYVAVNLGGLTVIPAAPHKFLVPNPEALNVRGRIVAAGAN